MASEDLRIIVRADGTDKATRDIKNVENAIGKGGLTGSIFKANLALQALNGVLDLAGNALETFKGFLQDSSEAATNYEKSMITLDIISEKFGVTADEAKDAADRLGRELRIGVGPAAESLQNLLKAGLGLEDAEELLRRFTNEAITGKSSSITLSQAVENLSFAYATNNSALGNLSGISENFNDIIEKGRESLVKEGKAAEDVTDEMAKFRGIMDLTNLTLGSSDRFTGTLVDTQAGLDQQMQDLQVTVGRGVNPILNSFLKNIVSPGITILSNFAERGINFLREVIQEAQPYIDIIKDSIKEFVSIIVGSNIDNEINGVGDSLKEAFKQEILDLIRDIALGTKNFIEYLKSPDGQRALQLTADLIRGIGDALAFLVRQMNEFVKNGGNSIYTLASGITSEIGQANAVTSGSTSASIAKGSSRRGSTLGSIVRNENFYNNFNIQSSGRTSTDDFRLQNAFNRLATQ